MKNKAALEYVKQLEWSMGYERCPECCGVNANWLGHPLYTKPETLGHKKDCPLALVLKECGENPLFKGQSKLQGVPCTMELPREDELREIFEEAILAILNKNE